MRLKLNPKTNMPFAITSEGLPLLYPNLYLLEVLGQKAYNTQLKHMRDIVVFELFIEHKKIPLMARLRQSAQPLEASELTDLKNYLSFGADSRKAYLEGRLLSLTDKRKKGSKSILLNDNLNANQRARADQYAAWRQIALYVDFLASKVRRELRPEERSSFDRQFQIFGKMIWNYTPSSRALSSKYQVKALPPNQFIEIVRLLIQTNPGDLFKTEAGNPSPTAERDRFYLVCLAMTAGRPSEVQNLRLRDFHKKGESYYIEFHDSRASEQFSRTEISPAKRARNKTHGRHNRVIPVPKALFDLREQYINGFYRKAIGTSISQRGRNVSRGFLFLKENGEPIGTRDYPSMLCSSIKSEIESVLQRAPSELTAVNTTHEFIPYTFRHSRATLYLFEAYEYAAFKNEKFNLEKAESDLRSFGGWSLKSDMPSKYAALFSEWRQDGINAKFAKTVDDIFAGHTGETSN